MNKITAQGNLGSESFALNRPQQVVLRTGGLISVAKLRPGDELMNGQSQPVSLNGITIQTVPAYEIQAAKSRSFFVGEDQPLFVGDRKEGTSLIVKSQDFARWPVRMRRRFGLLRARITFSPRNPLPLDPYLMGLLLGNGSFRRRFPSLTMTAPEIVEALYEKAEGSFWLVKASGSLLLLKGIKYPLQMLGLWGRYGKEKFIPNVYLRASREDRLQLLAGLIDTCGSLNFRTYEITTAAPQLAEDIAFLARGLGFGVRESFRNARTTRLYIYGDYAPLPLRVSRKKASGPNRINPLCAPFHIREAGIRAVCYLEVDSYLMGDLTLRKGGVL